MTVRPRGYVTYFNQRYVARAHVMLRSLRRHDPAAEWFGRFNAGCIYWKNDPVGRRCLIDYRADCIAWCAPQSMPDGRFMNQGYLTAWPQRYAGVHVIRHPGVNLAPWNIAGHSIDA